MIDQVSDQAKTEQWVRGLKVLSVLLLGAAVVWAGYAVYIKRQESKALEAFSALAQADVIEMRVVREAKVLSDDPVEVLREAPEADKTAYVAALEKVRAEHKGTTAGHIAALRLGRWYVTGKDFEKAEALYKELLSEIRGAEGEIFASMASEALGVIYENQSRWDDALKVYDASLANEQAALRPLLMLSKARVLTAQKKTEEAKAVYDGVVQSYPNTSYSQQARALSVKAAL
jgi:tetratricopeptide (TPR) repeat protein